MGWWSLRIGGWWSLEEFVAQLAGDRFGARVVGGFVSEEAWWPDGQPVRGGLDGV
jgi:hypothetical protein